MRLKQIELTNFRAIDDAIIEFDGKSTVIFGINGTGKSSILRSVNLLFANIINQVVNRKELKQNYAIQLEDIMYGKSGTSIHATIEFEGTEFEYSRNIKVIPVANFTFTMPSVAHTDTDVNIVSEIQAGKHITKKL